MDGGFKHTVYRLCLKKRTRGVIQSNVNTRNTLFGTGGLTQVCLLKFRWYQFVPPGVNPISMSVRVFWFLVDIGVRMVKQAAPRRALSRSLKHSSRTKISSPLTPWTSPSPPTLGHDPIDIPEWNPSSVHDHVYLDAAAIFQNAYQDKAATHRLISYGKRSKVPVLKFKDEVWQHRVYELAFNTLKCMCVVMYANILLACPISICCSRGTFISSKYNTTNNTNNCFCTGSIWCSCVLLR